MDLLTPRRSPNSALPLHTQKQCTARGSFGGLPPRLWPLKAPGSTFRGGSPSLSSAVFHPYKTGEYWRQLSDASTSQSCIQKLLPRGTFVMARTTSVEEQKPVTVPETWQPMTPDNVSNRGLPNNTASASLGPHAAHRPIWSTLPFMHRIG